MLRRALPLLALLPGAVRAQPAAAGGWSFKVMRNGAQIGTHAVRVTERGRERVTVSDVQVVPRVLGVVVYRFEHLYTEVTEGWRFRSVDSRLNRNGTVAVVRARATPEAVLVDGPEGALRLPPNAAPLSWWDASRLGGAVPIFGTTTGRLMDLRWTRRDTAGGFAIGCTGEVEAECLFARDGNWVGFSTKGDDGSTVTYAPA